MIAIYNKTIKTGGYIDIMNELWVEEKGKNYIVTINDDEYQIERREANRVAIQWGEIEPEVVAKIKATLMFAEEIDKNPRHMSWERFADGYGRLLDLVSSEELLSYMVDNLGYNLKFPDKLYEEIKENLYVRNKSQEENLDEFN